MRRIILTVALTALMPLLGACETRIIRPEERFFTQYSEENWSKLSPKMKAEYREMVERQKARGRESKMKEKEKKKPVKSGE